jgi:hypothetical protein
MWTYKSAKTYADKLGGKVVGSVKSQGKSDHDLDILVHEYTQGLGDILASMDFTYMGSQTVSPKEIRRSRKFGGRDDFWLRTRRFENLIDHRVIEVWTVEK